MMPLNSCAADCPDHEIKTLLTAPAVTIQLDGLIYTGYNETKRLYQAGIHIDAEKHHLIVQVWSHGHLLFPSKHLPWNKEHGFVKAKAPFWLYVDSDNGPPPTTANAELYEVGTISDEQSFSHILSLESLYHRDLNPLNGDRIAVFNFPDGICYSAKNAGVKLKEFDQGKDPSTAVFKTDLTISALGAIDIASTKTGAKRSIVLASVPNPGEERCLPDKHQEYFRFPLDEGQHYVIKIMNLPKTQEADPDPMDHFLQFYELFPLLAGEKVYMVDPARGKAGPKSSPPNSICIGLRGSIRDGLGL